VREVCRVLAGLLAVLVIAYPATLGGPAPPPLFAVATAAAVISGLVLWNDGAVTAAAAALAVNYLAALQHRQVGLDGGAPLIAAALVLFVELTDVAISVRPGTPVERSLVQGTAHSLAAALALTVVATAVVVVGAAPGVQLAGPVRLAATAAAVAAVGVPVWLLRIAR
jgi:hypothetical protein